MIHNMAFTIRHTERLLQKQTRNKTHNRPLSVSPGRLPLWNRGKIFLAGSDSAMKIWSSFEWAAFGHTCAPTSPAIPRMWHHRWRVLDFSYSALGAHYTRTAWLTRKSKCILLLGATMWKTGIVLILKGALAVWATTADCQITRLAFMFSEETGPFTRTYLWLRS